MEASSNILWNKMTMEAHVTVIWSTKLFALRYKAFNSEICKQQEGIRKILNFLVFDDEGV